jgi:hypothetical protein
MSPVAGFGVRIGALCSGYEASGIEPRDPRAAA